MEMLWNRERPPCSARNGFRFIRKVKRGRDTDIFSRCSARGRMFIDTNIAFWLRKGYSEVVVFKGVPSKQDSIQILTVGTKFEKKRISLCENK